MEFRPHAYQQYCIDKLIETPKCGIFLDMGLGKTVITLSALCDLKYNRFAIRKALVIAPKKVAEGTWTDEASKWDHLKGLRLSVVLGTSQQRIKALRQPADVYIINRENTRWIVDYYGSRWPFDTVVLDESSSFKNHRADRFRALRSIRAKISRLIELTGTPSPNGLMDLWAPMYLLDAGERLGRTITVYREMYFYPNQWGGGRIFGYTPRKGSAEAIFARISDICISMKAEDYLSMPDLVVDDIPVQLDNAARKAYDELEKTMLLTVSEDQLVTAPSAAVLTGKLLQLCNGAVYDENGEVLTVHGCKIAVFLETIEQLQGQHVLVYYHFTHDLTRLLDALKGSSLSVRVYRGSRDADDWNRGEVDVLLAQPTSCGYGLNLQQGGHHIIWFGLTWNLEEYLQANARLHRQGQEHPVIIHRLVVKGGTDEDVVSSLEKKDRTQDALLTALKARIDKVKGGGEG